MKRILSLIGGLLLAAVIGLAQGKWEQVGVSQYGTGGINRSGERIDNSYNAGKFNSEVKSTSKNNPYVYFRKGQFSVPAKTYQPGQTLTVSMSLSVKRHSGNGTPKGSAGATLVGGQAGQGTSVPSQISVSGKDAAKSGSVEMAIPSRSQAGNNFSIVYSCFDIKVVYLYRWVEDKPAAESVREPVVAAEAPVLPEIQLTEEEVQDSIRANEGIMLPDDTILPPADSAFFEESLEDEPVDASYIAEAAEALQNGELTKEGVKNALKEADTDTVLSLLGFDLTKKDLILYGIIGGLGLLVLILLLVLLFRKNPAKKAAKEEARKAAAEAKAAAKAEAAEKAAAAKAERDAKLAEQRAAATEKAAAAKAAQEAKRAELQAAQEAKRAELKAAQEAKAAELKQKQEAAKTEREAKLAEAKAAQEAKRAELKAAQEAKAAELKAKREAALAAKAAATAAAAAKAEAPKPEEKPAEKPAGKKFCENCGAPLDPDAVFCENCGTKVQ